MKTINKVSEDQLAGMNIATIEKRDHFF